MQAVAGKWIQRFIFADKKQSEAIALFFGAFGLDAFALASIYLDVLARRYF